MNTPKSQGLVDYFFVCGLDTQIGLDPYEISNDDNLEHDPLCLPPLERPYKNRMLQHFPEQSVGVPFEAESIAMMCLPHGLHLSTQKQLTGPVNHNFVITREDGSRIYGVAIRFWEEVLHSGVREAITQLQKMYEMEHRLDYEKTPAGRMSLTGANMYCQTADRLYAEKVIGLLTRTPFLHSLEGWLYDAWCSVQLPEPPALSIESHVYNLLFEVPLPLQDKEIGFNGVYRTHYCRRPASPELPLFEYSLRDMLGVLGIDNVIRLYTCALLEYRIVLFSQDYRVLMLVSEGITTLLFPFSWAHVYVPILPLAASHFLDAPVPFIMGVKIKEAKDAEIELDSEENVCYVHIDEQTVVTSDDVPNFPNATELRQEINEALVRYTCPPMPSLLDSSLTDPSAEPSGCDGGMEMSTNGDSREAVDKLERSRSCDTDSGLDGLVDQVNQEEMQLYVYTLKMNNAIREIFLDHFVNMMYDYETFLIRTKATEMFTYLSQNEAVQTFDKAAFLGDQPETSLPFLSAFLETQMFTNFTDMKLLSTWEDPDPVLVIFEQRLLAKHHQQLAMDASGSGGRQLNCLADPDSIYIATRPHEIQSSPHQHQTQRCHVGGQFPSLQADILSQRPTNMAASASNQQMSRMRRKERQHQPCLLPTISEKPEDFQVSDGQPQLWMKYLQEARRQTRQPNLSDMAPSVMAQTNWRFVDTLLRECKVKTKRMVVDKMGQKAIELGHGDPSVSEVEENAMVTELCDLLERIWSHGMSAKHMSGQGKSALWSHLVNYLEHETILDSNKCSRKEERKLPTTGEGNTLASTGSSNRGLNLTAVFGPARHSLIADIRVVQVIPGIETDVGYARAFVLLALEKKVLNAHLKKLLTNSTLLRDRYRRYAFLRCEEEREQFLCHLLALNAVDYFPFTTKFTTSLVLYRVFIYSGRKHSWNSTTANAWFCLYGQNKDTGVRPIPTGLTQFELDSANLGLLTTMRIGHDNSGISPKWFIEFVLVQNTVTGHIYRFNCNRWFGKGVDDSSIERLLVGEQLRISDDGSTAHIGYQTPPSITRRNSDASMLPIIRERLCNAVNNLVKHFVKPDKAGTNLTLMLCGELGLVPSLELAFNYGFRSGRLFQKKVYVWDYLEKVANLFASQWEKVQLKDSQRSMATAQLCRHINNISLVSQAIGKDGKFQRWICIGLRDHTLPQWLQILATSPITAQLYEERSFLRDEQLRAFVVNNLSSLDEFSICLEPALVADLTSQITAATQLISWTPPLPPTPRQS